MVKRKRQGTSTSESDESGSSGSESSCSSYGGSESGSSYGGSESGYSYGGSESSYYGGSERSNPRIASFSMNQILFGEEDSGSEDAYQSNGKSAKRVRKALQSGCCRRQCKRRLAFRSIMVLVTSFWALSKSGQDSLLWSLQHPVWTPQAESEDEESSNGSGSSSGGSSASGSSKSVRKVAWYLEGGVVVGC